MLVGHPPSPGRNFEGGGKIGTDLCPACDRHADCPSTAAKPDGVFIGSGGCRKRGERVPGRASQVRPEGTFREPSREPLVFRAALASPRCAACGSLSSRPAFEAKDWYLGRTKDSFVYRRCDGCGSVFMQPQPDEGMLASAYSTSYGPFSTTPGVVERLGERLAQREADRLAAAVDPTRRCWMSAAGRARS